MSLIGIDAFKRLYSIDSKSGKWINGNGWRSGFYRRVRGNGRWSLGGMHALPLESGGVEKWRRARGKGTKILLAWLTFWEPPH